MNPGTSVSNLIPLAALSALLAGGLAAQKDDPAKAPPEKVAKAAPLKVGDTVDPALRLRDIDGKEITFKELRGKVVFIHFWSTKCPWEKEAEPKIAKLEEEFAKDLVGIAINSNQGEIGADPTATKDAGHKNGEKEPGGKKDAAKDAKDPKDTKSEDQPYKGLRTVLEKKGLKFRVFVDHGNKISDLFQAATTPHSYVIDAKGVLRYAGALDGTVEKSDRTYVRDAIEAVLAGKEVKDKQTQPYG